MPDTPHLGLPLIEAAQAQKHVTHNEALVRLDTLVQLAVLSRSLTAPPAAPAEGDRYIVKATGSGAFAGKDNQLAQFSNGGWLFYPPKVGWLAFIADEGVLVAWDGSAWVSAVSSAGDISELQNLLRLGVGTVADATNPFSAKLNNALWVARTVGEGGDGNLRYKLSKEGAANTLSILYQDNFSGRAEIGLCGDDDFHFKVSPDGSSWIDALVLDKATGSARLNAGLHLSGDISPAQITADQNDYSPSGLAAASVLRLSSDAPRNLTGLAGGGDGRIVVLVNVGANSIVLKDASAASAAANRFAFGADVTLAAKQSAVLWYDAADARWKLLAGPTAAAGSGGSAAGGANLLLNGGFAVDQRNDGASVAAADDTYCLDRWYVLTQSAAITAVQQSDQEDGTPHNIRLTQNQAGAQRMGLAQIVEARDCKHLRGGNATFKARVRCSTSQAIRYAILGWTGAVDTVTSDVVNDWSSGTYTAGNFFLGANLSIIAVGATTPAAGAWTDLTPITGAVGTSINNLIVLIWTEATAAQNFTLDIARAKLESGSAATAFAARPYAEELALCQRYFESLSSTTGLEVYGVGQCASANRAISFYAFKAVKRAPPTLTLSAVADWAYYNQSITQFVVWSSVSAQLSPFGAMFDVTTATSGLGGAGQATMFGPNNTANARMKFDAEL
ncbi:MAG TPA: DUF2793 domain-containing protein [Xanthobacteraceae bacterium]|nr:DUF2793 domain-containing protein [Xanthobacteraceae bacterium]